ncbi:hypothetical protein HD554DRAFT_2026955 [Boletus coccyginus]|nr:hypothetical protein HD554DRAFT_2026955 [Boletus coccyginus]
MQLILSSDTSVRNTIFTHESGQVLYKTTHPLFELGMGTTTIYKVKPNDDPTDMRDQLGVIGEIEWHMIGPSTFRLNGQEMQSNTFLPSHGILGRKRTFTGPDGSPYRWDMLLSLSGTVVVRTPTRTIAMLSRNDGSRTEVARHHRGSGGIVGPKRKPRLVIDPDVEHMLDLIVLTFVYVEKVRMDKDNEFIGA